jgi:aryl-alcohol dehydrogenase-like predicted oxidoreductase
MRYKLLGNSGLRVSELALGTMTFGDENGHGVADETVSRNLFDAFLEAGRNFIDTANIRREEKAKLIWENSSLP